MAARFTPAKGLNEKVAVMVAPEVSNIAKQVSRIAKKLAPGVKTWVSMQDDAVRDTHVLAHGQARPENLRFALDSREYDRQNNGAWGTDYVLGPNDETLGLDGDAAQWIRGNEPWGCRCQSVVDPTGISKKIRTGPARVVGSTVTVTVSCVAPYVVAAEFGDEYKLIGGVARSEGTHFMRKAAYQAALGTRLK